MISPLEIALVSLGMLPRPQVTDLDIKELKLQLNTFPLLVITLKETNRLIIYKINSIHGMYLLQYDDAYVFQSLDDIIKFLNLPEIKNNIYAISVRNHGDASIRSEDNKQEENELTLYKCTETEWDKGACVSDKKRNFNTHPVNTSSREIKNILQHVMKFDSLKETNRVVEPYRLAQYSINMLPITPKRLFRNVEQKNWGTVFPHVSVSVQGEINDYSIFRTDDGEKPYLLIEDDSIPRSLSFNELLKFLYSLRFSLFQIVLNNQLDSNDRTSSQLIYACLPDEKEYEFDGGPCMLKRHEAASKLQRKVLRNVIMPKKIQRFKIKQELDLLPKKGHFMGGLEFQKAQERFISLKDQKFNKH
jgi:hypothetical protein